MRTQAESNEWIEIRTIIANLMGIRTIFQLKSMNGLYDGSLNEQDWSDNEKWLVCRFLYLDRK